MSVAPFAASRGDGGDGDGDDDNSSSYRRASDYGTSGTSSVHSDYDGSNASDAPSLIMMSIFHIKMVITMICSRIYFKRCQLMPTSIALPEQD